MFSETFANVTIHKARGIFSIKSGSGITLANNHKSLENKVIF